VSYHPVHPVPNITHGAEETKIQQKCPLPCLESSSLDRLHSACGFPFLLIKLLLAPPSVHSQMLPSATSWRRKWTMEWVSAMAVLSHHHHSEAADLAQRWNSSWATWETTLWGRDSFSQDQIHKAPCFESESFTGAVSPQPEYVGPGIHGWKWNWLHWQKFCFQFQ
jgi:hypothetical protein